MTTYIIILSIAIIVLFLYCCLIVASRSDRASERYLIKEREKENEN